MDDEPTPTDAAVTLQVGLSGVGVLLQAWLIDYGAGGVAVSVFWAVVWAFLLCLVHQRRSQVARWLLVVPGLLGAVMYATATIGGALPLLTGLGIVAGFALQGVAMLRPVVAEHCRTG